MSKYQFLADSYPYYIHLGWDTSIQSFFAVVADLNNFRTDRDNIVLSVGAEDAKLTEIEQLQNVIREYAEIPKAIICNLEADCSGTQFKEYEISGTWEYWGKSHVRARNLKEAIAIVEKNGLPLNGYYVDDSFTINYELLEEKYPDEADASD